MMAMMNIERQMELPTPRSMARTSYRVHVWCKACRNAKDADLGALIAGGLGNVPLIMMRWPCGHCDSGLTDFMVAGYPADPIPARRYNVCCRVVRAKAGRFVVNPSHHAVAELPGDGHSNACVRGAGSDTDGGGVCRTAAGRG